MKGEDFIYKKCIVKENKTFPASKNIIVAQLALALTQDEQIVPIPGSRSPERVTENAAAADVELTKADLQTIAEIIPNGSAGSRYPESILGIYTTD